MRIKRNDDVIVIAGKDRGKRGKVMRVLPAQQRVIVEGLNIVKRHTKPTPQGDQGGVIEREAPLHVSNVMLVEPQGQQAHPRLHRDAGRQALPRRPALGRAPGLDMSRLRERYEQEILPALTQRFGYSTPMQAPRVVKVTLNMGLGEAKQDSNMLDAAASQLATIAGQRPSVRRARKSIANFKLREGMPVGVAVTLRGERAYEFLDRLMSIAIPRIRDFRGLKRNAFDGRGNYSLGLREQIIFPEVDLRLGRPSARLDVTITTVGAHGRGGARPARSVRNAVRPATRDPRPCGCAA